MVRAIQQFPLMLMLLYQSDELKRDAKKLYPPANE
jgi:hypothetical protein